MADVTVQETYVDPDYFQGKNSPTYAYSAVGTVVADLSNYYTKAQVDSGFDDYDGWEFQYDPVTPQTKTITSGGQFGITGGTDIGTSWDDANGIMTINYAGATYSYEWGFMVNSLPSAGHTIGNTAIINIQDGTHTTVEYTFAAPTHGFKVNVDLTDYYTSAQVDAGFYSQTWIDSNLYTGTYIDSNFDDYGGWVFRPAGAGSSSGETTISSGGIVSIVAGTGIGTAWTGGNTLTITNTAVVDNYIWSLWTDDLKAAPTTPREIGDTAIVFFEGGTNITTEYNFNSGTGQHEVTINTSATDNDGTVTGVSSTNTNLLSVANYDTTPGLTVVTAAVINGGTHLATGDQIYDFVTGLGYSTNSGTVTSVNSATTGQLTIANGTLTPALTIVTGAVANGNTDLATGDQIYDFVIGRGYSTTVGTVTSVATGTGLTGGTITNTGTVSAASSAIPITATDLGASADLDTYRTAGFYYQNSNADATSGSNYPANLAGALTIKIAAGVVQEYHTYGGTNDIYTRTYYSGIWGSWRLISWTCSNQSNNRVITSTGSGEVYNAEANLTFNGSTNVLAVTGALTVSANSIFTGVATFNTHIYQGDNDYHYFGNSNDGSVVHNGSDFYISSTLHGANIILQGEDASGVLKTLLYGDPDNSVALYYAGSKKLYTVTGGIYINGSVTANGEIESYDSSDIQFKDNIEDLDPVKTTEDLMCLRTIRYRHKLKDKIELGLIAQEVQKPFPENVKEDGDGMLMIHYGKMIPALLATIQRHERRIIELEKRLGRN